MSHDILTKVSHCVNFWDKKIMQFYTEKDSIYMIISHKSKKIHLISHPITYLELSNPDDIIKQTIKKIILNFSLKNAILLPLFIRSLSLIFDNIMQTITEKNGIIIVRKAFIEGSNEFRKSISNVFEKLSQEKDKGIIKRIDFLLKFLSPSLRNLINNILEELEKKDMLKNLNMNAIMLTKSAEDVPKYNIKNGVFIEILDSNMRNKTLKETSELVRFQLWNFGEQSTDYIEVENLSQIEFDLELLSMNKIDEWLIDMKLNKIALVIAVGNCPKILGDLLLNENIMLIIIKSEEKSKLYEFCSAGKLKIQDWYESDKIKNCHLVEGSCDIIQYNFSKFLLLDSINQIDIHIPLLIISSPSDLSIRELEQFFRFNIPFLKSQENVVSFKDFLSLTEAQIENKSVHLKLWNDFLMKPFNQFRIDLQLKQNLFLFEIVAPVKMWINMFEEILYLFRFSINTDMIVKVQRPNSCAKI